MPARSTTYLLIQNTVACQDKSTFWPVTLPLTIDYPSFPSRFVPGDEDNIVAALEYPGHVHRIMIHAMGPLLTKVTTIMQKSFPVLMHLDLEWEPLAAGYTGGLPITGILLDGSAPHLQLLCLKCISFLQLPMFLLSAHNLVTLKLKDIFDNVLISLEVTIRCLAILTRLTNLSIMFHDNMSPPDPTRSRPDLSMQTIFPSLTKFHYGGYGKYLEEFLAQINTPNSATSE
ncbi:hypothetical protein V8E53_010917 [Lactarius tabidus]